MVHEIEPLRASSNRRGIQDEEFPSVYSADFASHGLPVAC